MRVKGGYTNRRRHHKILKIAKGQRLAKNRLFARANEAVLHSLDYATRDRHDRKREMRRLWIQRINAGARENGMSYSRFIEGLRTMGVEINRKMLADMAMTDPSGFTQLVKMAQDAQAPAA
jgi:large subunit ribosomal protein L20